MLYIFSALYAEASAIIAHYGLKKSRTARRFDEYTDAEEEICLVITGIGETAAAAAVSSICTKYDVNRDFIINIGTCAAKDKNGIFMCSSIREQASGRSFYPDIIYRHPFEEAALVTSAKPVHEPQEGLLYDMEAAGIYQAAAYFVPVHKIIFIKCVSDAGEEHITADTLKKAIESNLAAVAEYFDMLIKIDKSQDAAAEDIQYQKQLEADLHCSETMKSMLAQLLRYLQLSGADYKTEIEKMYQQGILPCADRKDGKRCLDEIKRRLL